jgi:uncharacterized membrane protein YvbJ
MDCPNCGVYNPEDRIKCWRCDQELPKPKETRKEQKDPVALQRRMWILVAVAVILWLLLTWVVLPLLFGGSATP